MAEPRVPTEAVLHVRPANGTVASEPHSPVHLQLFCGIPARRTQQQRYVLGAQLFTWVTGLIFARRKHGGGRHARFSGILNTLERCQQAGLANRLNKLPNQQLSFERTKLCVEADATNCTLHAGLRVVILLDCYGSLDCKMYMLEHRMEVFEHPN